MNDNLPEKGSEILIYKTGDGRTRLEVRLEGETVWLSQTQLCELFEKTNERFPSIFETYLKKANCREIQLTGNTGQLLQTVNLIM